MTPTTHTSIEAEASLLPYVFFTLESRLGKGGVTAPTHKLRLLCQHLLSLRYEELLPLPATLRLTPDQQGALENACEALVKGTPLSRILGHREFWSLSFALSPATLDPRPDSETLIEAALQHFPNRKAPHRLLDLGTGSGCLLGALLSEYPHAQGVGIDQSEEAVRMASYNLQQLGFQDRAEVFVSHWTSSLTGVFDIIVSNPPYISLSDYDLLDANVRLFDPIAALVAGPDGLDAYRALALQLPPFMHPSSLLFLELGHGQQEEVSRLFQEKGFHVRETYPDLAGIPRVLVLSYPGAL